MTMTAEDILKLADPWTAPISDGAPSGTSAKEDERYLVVTTEIARLDSPTTEKLDWKRVWTAVITSGGELLQEKSKDILIGSQVAYAMYRQDGLKGLLKGVALITVLVENFWPTLFPERIKGRAAAVQWFIDKSCIQLKVYAPVAGDRDHLDNVALILKRLNASAREKYGEACPAIGKLAEVVKNLLFDAGPSKEELDAQQAEVDATAAQQASQQAAQQAAQQAEQQAAAQRAAQQAEQQAARQTAQQTVQPVAPPMVHMQAPPPIVTGPAPTIAAPTAVAAAPPADVSQVTGWLGDLGASIAQTANEVRRAADATALAYRMTRIGLYMHLVEAPVADASGTTRVPPPNPNMRKQIETIASNKKWAPLLDETESNLSQSRFWLDLHRYTAQALAGLGESYAQARAEAVRELGVVLKRLPQLATLQFSDGTPFADPETRSWIDSEVMASGGGGGGMSVSSGGGAPVIVVQQGGGGADEETAVVNEAKKMAAAGNGAGAVAMLQAKAASAPSLASRFRYRLGIGQVALASAQVALAKGVFEGLERDVTAHGLEEWEPALAAASAEGLVQCYRALGRSGKPIPPEAGVLYDRVCRLDPATALRLGA